MMDATTRVLTALAPERARFTSFARARVGVEAEDVVQVAMLRAALKASSLEDESRVVAWFFRILRNTIADHLRKADPLRDGDSVDGLDEPIDPAPGAMAVCDCSSKILASMKPEHAEIVRRIDLEDQDLSEAAEALDITVNNAGVRLHRARRVLREAIIHHCGVKTVAECLDCSC